MIEVTVVCTNCLEPWRFVVDVPYQEATGATIEPPFNHPYCGEYAEGQLITQLPGEAIPDDEWPDVICEDPRGFTP
jgi:hypothetical protein